ncbi:LPS O-antigen chain length determinant protein WzzB [Pseudomonas donghuensis]|uniref:LPS O-antigen chain length determinant protein WzzB n=1 Tax=Pseudomonas donghuensis TaxID=1163398 RepID=UPI002E0E348B|nr:Wzz/FepE/Etk N-terminal domain-containing protein [Pseudomonas donghuensis]
MSLIQGKIENMANERSSLNEQDEIDLIEVLKRLKARWLLIVLSMAVFFVVAVIYALLAKPVYEVKVFVQSPTHNDIANLNYGRGGDSNLDVLKVKDVYEVYLRHLQSESLRREFFQKVYLPTVKGDDRAGSQDALYERFNKMLLVAPASKDPASRYAITANISDPNEAAAWVVDYALQAGQRAKDEVLKNIKSDSTVKANNLEQQIDSIQESSRKEREDKIVQLQEALRVARSIGLEKPSVMTGKMSIEITSGLDGALAYMRGSKALEAEIANLQTRQSDDPFIGNLREQQERLAFYRSLDIDPSSVAVFRQDGVVEVPDQPIKPKKFLLVLMGLVVGFIAGIVLVFIWPVRQRRADARG